MHDTAESTERSSRPDVEVNKATIRRLFDECFNQGHLAVLDEIVALDYRGGPGPTGPAAFRNIVGTLRTAIPDIHYDVEELVADGNKVAVRWHWRGRHDGPFRPFAPGAAPVPATGKPVVDEGFAIFELNGGRIARSAILTDRLGFLQAIGVVPPSEQLFRQRPSEGFGDRPWEPGHDAAFDGWSPVCPASPPTPGSPYRARPRSAVCSRVAPALS